MALDPAHERFGSLLQIFKRAGPATLELSLPIGCDFCNAERSINA
jgi:hypothetical protein